MTDLGPDGGHLRRTLQTNGFFADADVADLPVPGFLGEIKVAAEEISLASLKAVRRWGLVQGQDDDVHGRWPMVFVGVAEIASTKRGV